MRRGTDQSRQARTATPAGVDAEHHLGQADLRGVVVGGDAQAAGQCQLGAAAHAGAMDGGDCRAGKACQALEDALAVLDVVEHRAGMRVFDELADVRTHREAGGLGGVDDDALGVLDGETLDEGVQFIEHLARQRIGAGALAVEGEHDDAVVAHAGLPVLESKSFEHGRSYAGE